MNNAIICAARAAWYATMEPTVLNIRRAAWRHWDWSFGNPLISVYIPTHNRCNLLMTRALPSILNQTYRNIEVIVAAHGCTDATVFGCGQQYRTIPSPRGNGRTARTKDDRIRVIEVPRTRTYPPTAGNHWLAGPVVPANAALKACRGMWIARCDDDDEWTPDHLEKLLRYAQGGDYEFVSAAHETHEGKIAPYNLDGTLVGGTQTWLYRHYLKHFRYNIDCWRKTWNRVNDTDLQARMHAAGVRMGYLDHVLAKVMPRPGETEVGSKAYRADAAATERKLAFTA